MPLTSPIDRRIASRLHIQSIENLRRIDGLCVRLDRLATTLLTDLSALLAEPFHAAAYHAKLAAYFIDSHAETADYLAKLAAWNRAQSTATLIGTVPRLWWRKLIPTLPLKLKEAIGETPPWEMSWHEFLLRELSGRSATPALMAEIRERHKAAIQQAAFVGYSLPAEVRAEYPDLAIGAVGSGIQPPGAPPIATSGTPEEPEDPLQFKIDDEPIRAGTLTATQQSKLVEKLIFPPLSREATDQIVFSGNWQQRYVNLSRQFSDPSKIAAEISQGLSAGENLQQLRTRLSGVTNATTAAVKRVARTEGMRVAGSAQHKSFNSLGDLLSGYQHHSVLDQNSRPYHAILNGRVYHEEGEPNVREIVIEPYSDRLPNCRCFITPVLHPPGKMKSDPALKAAFSNAHQDEIPDPAAYDRWFSNADHGTRKEAVGIGRYEAMRDKLRGFRDPEWTDFVSPDGKLMPSGRLSAETADEHLSRKNAVNMLLRERERQFLQVSRTGFE